MPALSALGNLYYVKLVRLSIAAAAISAILAIGSLVALAAPKALTAAASPQSGAARAVYCPKDEKKRRQSELNAFTRTMAAARKKYFASHPKAKARIAFLRTQQAQLHALQRALGQCS